MFPFESAQIFQSNVHVGSLLWSILADAEASHFLATFLFPWAVQHDVYRAFHALRPQVYCQRYGCRTDVVEFKIFVSYDGTACVVHHGIVVVLQVVDVRFTIVFRIAWLNVRTREQEVRILMSNALRACVVAGDTG